MMPGLVTRDASGVVTANMTMSLSQCEGSVITNRANGSKLISLPEGKSYFYVIAPLEDAQRTNGKMPGVTLTQSLITWSYQVPSGFPMNCEIYYGWHK